MINASFPHLDALPSLETYALEGRAYQIIASTFRLHQGIVGVYILSSEARVPLDAIRLTTVPGSVVIIVHERMCRTVGALADGTLAAVITQDPGQLVRRVRAWTDGRKTKKSKEKIRIEVLLKANV